MKIRYLVATDARKSDQIARIAGKTSGPLTVLVRGTATARQAERELRTRGFAAHAFPYNDFKRSAASGAIFGYDAPFTVEQITDNLRDGDLIVAERSELPHLKNIAADANVQLEAASVPVSDTDTLDAFRNEIRKAVREEDVAAQMLVLEPLFEEFSAEEIAAAAAALLRAKRPVKTEASGGAREGTKTWSRLFFSVGGNVLGRRNHERCGGQSHSRVERHDNEESRAACGLRSQKRVGRRRIARSRSRSRATRGSSAAQRSSQA
jgi:hypothetical protein